MTTTSTLGVGDLITALPIPKHVTAVRGIYSDGRRSRIVWERRHDGWRFSSERRSAVALLGTFDGGLIVHAVAAPAEPEDITVEPPVGSKVTDRNGDVWTRFPEGWRLAERDPANPRRGLSWADVRNYAPLREPRPGDSDDNPAPEPEGEYVPLAEILGPPALVPGNFTLRRIIAGVHDGLEQHDLGGVTTFAWDGQTLTLGVSRCPRMGRHLTGDVKVTAGDPRITLDYVLVWTGTATVDGIDTTVPVRVTWTPERTGAVQ